MLLDGGRGCLFEGEKGGRSGGTLALLASPVRADDKPGPDGGEERRGG